MVGGNYCQHCKQRMKLRYSFRRYCASCKANLKTAHETANLYSSKGAEDAFYKLINFARDSGIYLGALVKTFLAADKPKEAKSIIDKMMGKDFDFLQDLILRPAADGPEEARSIMKQWTQTDFRYWSIAYNIAKNPRKIIDLMKSRCPPDYVSKEKHIWVDGKLRELGKTFSTLAYFKIRDGQLFDPDSLKQWSHDETVRLGYERYADYISDFVRRGWTEHLEGMLIYDAVKHYSKVPNGLEQLMATIGSSYLSSEARNDCEALFLAESNRLEDLYSFLASHKVYSKTEILAAAARVALCNDDITNAIWIALGYPSGVMVLTNEGNPIHHDNSSMLRFAPYLVNKVEFVDMFFRLTELVKEVHSKPFKNHSG